ncbi:MAG: NAD(P)/FAD-dependent oxidoreductase [Bacillota bacterium]
MKVAIVGAGPSGLSCALELERHGIFPVVFEQRHRPGELFNHSAAVLKLFTRPFDPLEHLRESYGVDVCPISRLKYITMKSAKKKVTVTGDLGYFIKRGNDNDSVETQLCDRLKSKVVANTKADYLELSRRFDYVVVASGNYNASRTEGVWSLLYPSMLIGGTVIGSFDIANLVMWVDTRYSKTAYAYLAPIEKKRAFLGLVVPDSTPEEARLSWSMFWRMENHPYNLLNEILIQHNAGFVYPHQVGNILFVGIAGGFLEPFLGFGMLSSIKSGVLAARAIATGRSFEDLIFQLKEDMLHSMVMRELFDDVKNDQYDLLLKVLSAPGLKQSIYNTNIDFVRMGTAAAGHFKALVNIIKNK